MQSLGLPPRVERHVKRLRAEHEARLYQTEIDRLPPEGEKRGG